MDISLVENIIVSIFLAVYYWLESIFLFFFPPARKVVRGEVALITGAGSGIGEQFFFGYKKCNKFTFLKKVMISL